MYSPTLNKYAAHRFPQVRDMHADSSANSQVIIYDLEDNELLLGSAQVSKSTTCKAALEKGKRDNLPRAISSMFTGE
jgi:hypothetical protein